MIFILNYTQKYEAKTLFEEKKTQIERHDNLAIYN